MSLSWERIQEMIADADRAAQFTPGFQNTLTADVACHVKALAAEIEELQIAAAERECIDPTSNFLCVARSETTLADCPPGLFMFGDSIGFKTEYRDDNGPEAYCLESGEYFWGGTDDREVRRNLQVRPAFFMHRGS